jgi:hypothetical protein
MSLFADLFSCGRARKPTPIEPHYANDTVGATPQNVSDETATANDMLTTDTPYAIHERTKSYGNSIWDQARDEVRKDTQEQDDAVGEDDNGRVEVVEEKAKQSSGWMVERRVLVTATPPCTANAAPVADIEPETCEVTPPIRCATPEPELGKTIGAAHTRTEPESIEGTSTVLTENGHVSEEVNASMSVEKSETLQEAPVVEQATSEPKPPSAAEPISFETPEAEVTEIAPLAPEAEAVADVTISKAKAPVGLLDLPPGMSQSSLFFMRANRTQRSGSISTTV